MERTERARVVAKKKKARFAALAEAAAAAKRRRVVEPVACAVDVAGVENASSSSEGPFHRAGFTGSRDIHPDLIQALASRPMLLIFRLTGSCFLPGVRYALANGLRHWPDLQLLNLYDVDFAHVNGEEEKFIEAINQHGRDIRLNLTRGQSAPQPLLMPESYGPHVELNLGP